MVYLVYLDWVSLRFSGYVILISGVVLIYSLNYIGITYFLSRFIVLVCLFVLSILLIIISPNIIRILLGWDGLGLVSYCLVIFYQNIKSANSGILTILSNRIGDIAILLSISWLIDYGSWSLFWLVNFNGLDTSLLIRLLILAAITKRAQLPFSAWLPAAIAAPTPVSSLVHSSTLVTAGVYLLIRFSEVIGVNLFLIVISTLTMFMSGLSANFEVDLKKIIALSTLSQLGVIIMRLSIGLRELSYFHLLTHALFKSLLFLCAGVYIHNALEVQDIRLLGGVSLVLPLTSLFFIGSSLSLCGFPYLSGFYSKDLILEFYFINKINFIIYLLVVVSTLFTLSYRLRLLYFLLLVDYKIACVKVGEELLFFSSILVLFITSIYSGAYIIWLYIDVYIVSLLLLKKIFFLIIFIVLMVYIGDKISLFSQKKTVVKNYFIFNSFAGIIFFIYIMRNIINKYILYIGSYAVKRVDYGWLEFIGPQGVVNSLKKYSFYSDYLYLLNINFYLVFYLVCLVLYFLSY